MPVPSETISVALEHRLLLGDESLVGAREILRLHADRLGLRLGLDGLFETHAPFLVEHGLGHHVCERRPRRDAAGIIERFGFELIGGHDAVEEAPGEPFFGGHGAARVEKVGGASLPDDAREDGTRAHVAARKAYARKEEGRLRLGRRDAQIGRHGDDGTGAGADAIDGADDGLSARNHGLDEIARHAREGEQALHVHLDERADDVVHVAAGTEIAAV